MPAREIMMQNVAYLKNSLPLIFFHHPPDYWNFNCPLILPSSAIAVIKIRICLPLVGEGQSISFKMPVVKSGKYVYWPASGIDGSSAQYIPKSLSLISGF
jgi:hypothetical protein